MSIRVLESKINGPVVCSSAFFWLEVRLFIVCYSFQCQRLHFPCVLVFVFPVFRFP